MSMIRFQLNSLRVNGAAAFDSDEFERFYQDKLAREISIAALFQIRADIQQLYLDHGYSLSKVLIPDQNIQKGNIVFQVIEGYVGDTEVTESLSDIPMILDFVSEVTDMKPLNVKKLERMMLILNDRPGLQVASVLANVEDNDDPGAVKLILHEADAPQNELPVSGHIAVDNYGSVFSGSGQVGGALTLKDAGINLSDLTVQARTTTSLPELQQISFDYTQPVFGVSGTNIGMNGSMSFTEPGSSLDELDVVGRSRALQFSLEHPIIRQRDENLLFSTNFIFRNSETDILQTEVVNDRLRILKILFDYSKADSYKGLNFLGLSFSKGFSILNASSENDDDLSRIDGKGDFRKITASYTRIQSCLITGVCRFQPLASILLIRYYPLKNLALVV